MKKIKAFTLLELTVTMLLTTIVVGTAYGAYRVVFSQVDSYRETTEKVSDVVQLDHWMKKDIALAKEVLLTEEGVQMSNASRTVEYQKTDDAVIRIFASRTDTFHLRISNWVCQWQNQEQHVSGELIDQVSFEGTIEETTLPFYYKKQYGLDVLMNYESSTYDEY